MAAKTKAALLHLLQELDIEADLETYYYLHTNGLFPVFRFLIGMIAEAL